MLYLVKARAAQDRWGRRIMPRYDYWLVRAESAYEARHLVHQEVKQAWGEDFNYAAMKITRALRDNQIMQIIHQE